MKWKLNRWLKNTKINEGKSRGREESTWVDRAEYWTDSCERWWCVSPGGSNGGGGGITA